MRNAPRVFALLIALSLVAAACGDSDSVLGTVGPASTAPTTTAATTPPTTAAPVTTEPVTTTTGLATTTTTEAPPATTTTTLPPGPAVPVLTPFDASEMLDEPPLIIGVVVPIVSGIPAAAADGINSWIGDEILGMVAGFKSEIASFVEPPFDPDTPSQMEAGYLAPAITPRLLSLRFDVWLYYTGAAHGLSSIITMNFDPQTGMLYALEDILIPGTFGAVAGMVEQALTDELYGGNAAEAAGWLPVLDEFVLNGWAVTPDGLAFSFDQYEVGFGAMGSPTVVIPWADLAAVIDPGGPAAEFAFG